jgi:hypothetical protein
VYLLERLGPALLLLLHHPLPHTLGGLVALRVADEPLALAERRLARELEHAAGHRLAALRGREVEVGVQRAGEELRVHKLVQESVVLGVRAA